jgi:hypothetical protein
MSGNNNAADRSGNNVWATWTTWATAPAIPLTLFSACVISQFTRRRYPGAVSRYSSAEALMSVWEELATPGQLDQFERLARERAWGLALLLIGWLHLLAFSVCYYLTIAVDYHDAPGYLAIWLGELLGVGLIFHLCAGQRTPRTPFPPLARFSVRVWLAYFVLAFNLATMNKLRGHGLFELFPAMASLASFAFLVMTFAVSRWFFAAVLVMFVAGELMSAYLLHAYLIFALAWWLVLNGIGAALVSRRAASFAPLPPTSPRPPAHSAVQAGIAPKSA